MKVLSGFLIVMTAIFFSYQVESADRLHHWVDAKGVTHLSQEPPPQDGKLIEIKGQKQLIESSSGKIEFSYRRSSDDRTYGDNHADCVNGHVISIP